jgi:hypothetical protein
MNSSINIDMSITSKHRVDAINSLILLQQGKNFLNYILELTEYFFKFYSMMLNTIVLHLRKQDHPFCH